MDDGLARMVRRFPEPRFLKQVHVGIEDVAAEGRVGEHIVDRAVIQVRQLLGRRDLVTDVPQLLGAETIRRPSNSASFARTVAFTLRPYRSKTFHSKYTGAM